MARSTTAKLQEENKELNDKIDDLQEELQLANDALKDATNDLKEKDGQISELTICVASLQEALNKPKKSKQALKDRLGKEKVEKIIEVTKQNLPRYFIFIENEQDEIDSASDVWELLDDDLQEELGPKSDFVAKFGPVVALALQEFRHYIQSQGYEASKGKQNFGYFGRMVHLKLPNTFSSSYFVWSLWQKGTSIAIFFVTLPVYLCILHKLFCRIY